MFVVLFPAFFFPICSVVPILSIWPVAMALDILRDVGVCLQYLRNSYSMKDSSSRCGTGFTQFLPLIISSLGLVWSNYICDNSPLESDRAFVTCKRNFWEIPTLLRSVLGPSKRTEIGIPAALEQILQGSILTCTLTTDIHRGGRLPASFRR